MTERPQEKKHATIVSKSAANNRHSGSKRSPEASDGGTHGWLHRTALHDLMPYASPVCRRDPIILGGLKLAYMKNIFFTQGNALESAIKL